MVVEKDVVVTVEFELRDAQGEVIQPRGSDDIVYLHGSEDEIFDKLQQQLEGKQIGEEVFVQLEPEEAFGDYDPELLRIEDQDSFPEGLTLGMQLEEVPNSDPDMPDELSNEDNTGFGRVWTVTEMAEDKVVLDGNHPLAGMALKYHLIVKNIREASEEEKLQGAAAQSLFSVVPDANKGQLH